MIVLDRQDYINKAMDLLVQRDTYNSLTADPLTKQKKLMNTFKTIKAEEGLGTSHTQKILSNWHRPLK